MKRHMNRILLISTILFAGIACDTNDSTIDSLTAEIEQLQAENDSLRASTHLAVAPPSDLPAPSITLREQGKPWQKYLPTAESQTTIAEIMKACGAKPITVSSSGYDPDATTTDDQVLSLGYSYMGGAKARACLDEQMNKRGAVDL